MQMLESSGTPSPAINAEALRHLTLSNLFKSHHKRLYLFISARVRHPADSQDLMSQTFVEACKALASFRGESEMTTWLYGIAMNLVRSHFRRAPDRRHEFVDSEILDDLVDFSESPSARLEDKELVGRLQKHMDELPSELQDVLTMVTLDELSYEEAASRLSIPIGTVRSRVWRARLQLRQNLAVDGISVHVN